MKRIIVSPYDPAWPRTFERIRAYLWPSVKDVAIDVEHVGSTSVPGLSAKPVIDACVVVTSRRDVQPCIERLASIGYVHRGDLGVPDREAFSQPNSLPKHHLYLSPRGCLSLKNHIGLRDYLRSHREAADEYGQLKSSLARRYPEDMDSYIAGKTDLILRILGNVGLTDAELASIRGINRP